MKTTQEYFGLSRKVLQEIVQGEYTREECMLLKEGTGVCFCCDKEQATRAANYYKEHKHRICTILEMTDSRIVVFSI